MIIIFISCHVGSVKVYGRGWAGDETVTENATTNQCGLCMACVDSLALVLYTVATCKAKYYRAVPA